MSRQKRDIAGHRDIGQGDKNTSPSCRGFRPQSITPIPRLSLVLFWSVENPNQKPPSLREKRSMAFPRRVAAAPPLPQAGGHPTSHRSPPAARQGPRGRAGRNHCARGSNAAPGRPSSSCPRAPLERPRHTLAGSPMRFWARAAPSGATSIPQRMHPARAEAPRIAVWVNARASSFGSSMRSPLVLLE